MSRVGIAIAVLLIAAGVVRAPVPSALWTGLATIGALGLIRRKRRRAHI